METYGAEVETPAEAMLLPGTVELLHKWCRWSHSWAGHGLAPRGFCLSSSEFTLLPGDRRAPYKWWARRESNPQSFAGTGFWDLRVYQFHHSPTTCTGYNIPVPPLRHMLFSLWKVAPPGLAGHWASARPSRRSSRQRRDFHSPRPTSAYITFPKMQHSS